MNELIARDGAVHVYGAYLLDGGTRLAVHLAFLRPGIPEQAVTLLDPTTNREIRVRLPQAAVNSKGFIRASRELWEVL